MEGYNYPYPSQYAVTRPPDGEYPDHGDGFGEYYEMGHMDDNRERRRSRSRQRKRRSRTKKSRSRSASATRTKSRSRSLSQSKSRSQSRSRLSSRSRSRSRAATGNRHHHLNFKEPSFLDAFRILYLTPSKHKKSTSKYLATKKRQDRVQEILKSDGLGSKRWLFYPRPKKSEQAESTVPGVRDNVDQRVKVDGDFFRKYKRSKKVAEDAPIAKLKRWELILYKKLGFVQAI